MRLNDISSESRLHWIYFGAALILIVGLYALYAVNIFRWQNSPDFGWRTMYSSGPNVVAEVFGAGEEAGLEVGDAILAINGETYSTFDELFFTVRNNAPGSINRYTVDREDETREVSIRTGRLGLKSVLRLSGPIYIIGFVYVVFGFLVFLMKPRARESWLFLVMTSVLGLEISYGASSDLMRPAWLYDVRLAVDMILPASLIHLALRFPKKRLFVEKVPWFWVVPYAISLALFVLYKIYTSAFWDSVPLLDLFWQVYLMSAVLIFLISTVWNLFRETSIIVRLQSQTIFLGILLGIFVPAADMLMRFVGNIYLFPDPAIGVAIFLSFFPLSIGYTIVKHDLFAIDVFVRRTYGYILSTAAIVAAYGLIVSGLNFAFRGSEISRSPLFSIGFALAVVFLFRPIHERFQGFVDWVFYRQKYDYRTAITSISEAITSILEPALIHRTLIDSAVREMFLENGLLLSLDRKEGLYRLAVAEGVEPDELEIPDFSEQDPLLRMFRRKNRPIFRSQVDLHPHFEQDRGVLQNAFKALHSQVMFPMKYKDEMRGIISLGGKKSGKMFTPEDLDLLKTLINQSVIALENAKLFEENIEKTRLEEELKIAHDIQVSMLPDKAPEIEGYAIAARSIPAKEVGGDFYDFIAMGGEGGEKLGIVVGDVSGKAVSGALVMAASRSILRVLAETHVSVPKIMTVGNTRLNRDVKKGMFVALVYAVLDPLNKVLTVSNAGQTQPVVCTVDEPGARYIETEGDRFPLGIVEECDYRETEVTLKPKDTVVFYTDGVVEAMNAEKELYGFQRFLASIEDSREMDAKAILETLMDDIFQFAGDAEQHDDITIVVLKVK